METLFLTPLFSMGFWHSFYSRTKTISQRQFHKDNFTKTISQRQFHKDNPKITSIICGICHRIVLTTFDPQGCGRRLLQNYPNSHAIGLAWRTYTSSNRQCQTSLDTPHRRVPITTITGYVSSPFSPSSPATSRLSRHLVHKIWSPLPPGNTQITIITSTHTLGFHLPNQTYIDTHIGGFTYRIRHYVVSSTVGHYVVNSLPFALLSPSSEHCLSKHCLSKHCLSKNCLSKTLFIRFKNIQFYQ